MKALESRIARASLRSGVAVAALLLSGTAFAQEADTATDVPTTEKDIVVTGTLIRGIAPVGSDVIGVGTEKIEANGGQSTNQILTSLPQVGNFFNALPAGVSGVSGANGSNPISRPNLRNLPAANTSGGAQTLVLLDGHRVVGAGIQQLAVDPDLIAPSVIERVEALTDGGSAVYGSDALGGVLNFITRKRYDGVKVEARYGTADDYQQVDANILAGKAWDTGSVYVSYNYAWHDSILGSERDFVKRIDWNTGVPVGRNCANPNVTIGTTSYVVSGATLAAGAPNTCDPSDNQAIYPEITTHNVFARINQDLSDTLTFDMTFLYGNRKITGIGGVLGEGNLGSGSAATVTICPPGSAIARCTASAFYRPVAAAPGQPQTVSFNYGPIAGFHSNVQQTNLETWNIAPSFTWKLGGDWQARAMVDYGEARTTYRNTVVSATGQATLLATGQLNPYDVRALTSTQLATLFSYDQGVGRNEFLDARVIADGPIFALPAGDVRVAVGAEYLSNDFRTASVVASSTLPPLARYKQDVKSVFGEVNVPVFGGDEGPSLNVSGSARYDKYNDFGDTFNPKVGATFRALDWLSLRASWGQSFNAPSPVDQLGVATSTAALIPGAFLAPPPGRTFAPGETGVFLAGAVPGLQPQTADSWSVGFDMTPTDGLSLSMSYYEISLDGTIGRPVSGTGLASFYQNYPSLSIFRPTGQQVAAALANIPNPANIGFTLVNPTSTAQALVSSGGSTAPVGVILDTAKRNLGTSELAGLDFSANFTHDTGFGSIDASFAGNYRIKQDTQGEAGTPVADELASEVSRMVFSATVGANIGNLRAQATLNHTSGYRRADAGQPTAFGQTNVDAFDTVNLFFKYDFDSEGLMKDLSLTLNVSNVFDADPPLYKLSTQPGYDPSHTLTVGRMFQFGISKEF